MKVFILQAHIEHEGSIIVSVHDCRKSAEKERDIRISECSSSDVEHLVSEHLIQKETK